MFRVPHTHFLVAGVLLFGTTVSAASPVVAVLDPGHSDRVPLLEAKLASDPGLTLVDRSAVDALLKEQQLQAAFGPAGVHDRVRLGKILKADLLVLVRPAGEAKAAALEVVVSETGGGLRLLHGSIAVSADAAADVDALGDLVRAGLRKSAEPIVEIVAVPPFLSRDLTFEQDHLKAAYARLAEQAVLGRQGVVVVELVEAEAVAKELALTAPGSRLERPLPLYLLGEFRHDGIGVQRRATLKLRAERGGKPVFKPIEQVLESDAVPGVVRQWGGGAVADTAGRPMADAASELRGLTSRAAEFRRIAAWMEALSLFEAALLLDPGDPQLHGQALISLSQHLRTPGRARDLETIRETQRLISRGWEHLEAIINRPDGHDAYRKAFNIRSGDSHSFLACIDTLRPLSTDAKPVQAVIVEILKDADQRLLKLIPLMAKWGTHECYSVTTQLLHHKPAAERYALAERVILETRDSPGAQVRTRMCLESVRVGGPARMQGKPDLEADAARKALFERLDATGDPNIRAAVNEVRTKEAREAANAQETEGPRGVTLQPLVFTDAAGARVKNVEEVGYAGPGIDYAWAGGTLYLSKAKSRLQQVWNSEDRIAHLLTAVHDGRYLWALVRPTLAAPRLLVVDPVAETVQEVLAADGLPQPGAEAARASDVSVMLAPLDPGRICLVGTYGRTWVAVATIAPATKTIGVKVIHEAHEVPNTYDKIQAAKSTIEFRPSFLFAMRGPKEGEHRVVVGRGWSSAKKTNSFAMERPLVIDPDRGTVEVGERLEDISSSGVARKFAVTPEVLYRIEPGGTLVRLGPTLKPERIAAGMPAGKVSVSLVREGRYHFLCETIAPPPIGKAPAIGAPPRIDREWWSVRLDGTELQKAATQLPRNLDVRGTAHHGLVAIVPVPGPVAQDVRTLEFTP